MQPAGQVVVSLPPTDRPALADGPTRMAVEEVTRGYRVPVPALLLLGVLLLGHLANSRFRIDETAVLLFGCLLMLCMVEVVLWLWIRRGHGNKLRTLLADAPWRPVPVQLVRGGPKSTRCVVRLTEEPVLLRISAAPWAIQQVIGRTGRLWMVGPDAGGNAAVNVDAGRGGFFAKVVHELPPVLPPVVTTPSGMGKPLDDPVTASAAAPSSRFLARLLATVLLLSPLITAATAYFGGGLAAALAAGLLAAGVVACGWELRVRWQFRRLRSGLRAGPWTPLPVRLGEWPDRSRLHANVSGEVLLPDGTVARVMLPRANMDLFVNAIDSGVLWVAGEPARGGTFAVGVPGYPVLGMARLR